MKNKLENMAAKSFLLMVLLLISILGSAQEKKPVLKGQERLDRYEKIKQMKKDSPYKEMNWQYIGPTNISGRGTDVEAFRTESGNYHIYFAAATGGVWKSENQGMTFFPVFDQEVTSSMGDIAIAPSNTDIVYIGTGEANIFRSSNAGCGVFKTTDGGKTWNSVGLADTYTISRMVVHPDNPDIVYVAATGHEWTANKERGVFKTTDGGKSWEQVLFVSDMAGANDLVMDPNNPEVLYATSWERIRKKWNDPRNHDKTKHSGIWKTSDGGNNWEKINNGLPEAQYRGRIGIDIARSNPNVLYAYVDNYETAYKAKEGETDAYGRQKQDVIKGATIFRSDDKGETWKQVSGIEDKMKRYMERHSATYGWVFAQMRVDPNDENTIYTMGLWLNVSHDGGKTFKPLYGMHADQHGLWIDPDNSMNLLNVHDGGFSISYDGGKNWNSCIEQLPCAQFYNVSYDMNTPFNVYGSIQDHHSFKGVVDFRYGRNRIQPTEWSHTIGAEGSSHAVDTRDNNTVYASTFYGALGRDDESGREQVLPARYPEEDHLRGQWVAPTLLSTHNQDIVYHGMQYVMMSRDKGHTWEYISPDLTNNDPEKYGDISHQTISALDESPMKFGLIYAGTDDGRIWRTKDGGENWDEIRSGSVPERWVSRLVASRYNMGTVYMTQTGRRDDDHQVYIWKSEDFGENWTDISGNLPLGPVNVIREDPFNRSILYVGTDNGVFISKDGGAQWDILGDLPSTYVHDLKIHPRDNFIIIATHGRGMFVMDADEVNERNKRRRFR